MILLWAALAMAMKDGAGTLMVIAEARGRAITAGILDALGDLAVVLTTLFGAGQIIVHGWTLGSFEVLAVIMVTSAVGTTFWTRVGSRFMAETDRPRLRRRPFRGRGLRPAAPSPGA